MRLRIKINDNIFDADGDDVKFDTSDLKDLYRLWLNAQAADGQSSAVALEALTQKLESQTQGLEEAVAANTLSP